MNGKWTKSSEKPVDISDPSRADLPLSKKRMMFVHEYVKDFNVRRAARAVGYGHEGSGYRVLKRAEVRKAIAEILQEKVMTAEEVLARLSEQARGDYAEYLLPNGSVDLGRMLSDGKGHLIKGYKQTASGLQVEFYDSQTALSLVGKHLMLFTEKVEMHHSGQVNFTADEAAQADRELEEWKKSKEASESSGSSAPDTPPTG